MQNKEDFEREFKDEILKLDKVELAALDAYIASLKGQKVGDMSFLSEIRNCIKLRSKLLKK